MDPVETPDERAARLITEQVADADSFQLVPGGQHNIAFFKWTWPDIQGTLHCTYFVKGAKAAVMVPGENKIKVSFNVVGEEEIKSVVEDFKGIVQAKLIKASVTKSMTTCEEYLDKLLEQKTRRNTVSIFSCLLIPCSCLQLTFLLLLLLPLLAGVWPHPHR